MDELDLLLEIVAECMELLHALLENPNDVQALRKAAHLLNIHDTQERN